MLLAVMTSNDAPHFDVIVFCICLAQVDFVHLFVSTASGYFFTMFLLPFVLRSVVNTFWCGIPLGCVADA